MLLDTIRADLLAARKDAFVTKNRLSTIKSELLSTLIGEAEMIGKNQGNRPTTDDETVQVAAKFVKNANETYKHSNTRANNLIGVPNTSVEIIKLLAICDKALMEIGILNQYLPKQASEEDIRAVIAEVGNNIGMVMKSLIAKFGKNGFDANLAKSLISG